MDPWNYISPSSGDLFNNINSKEFTEAYFEIDHESNGGSVFNKKTKDKQNAKLSVVSEAVIKQEMMSPNICDSSEENKVLPNNVVIKQENVTPVETRKLTKQDRRRSLSANDISKNAMFVSEVSDLSNRMKNVNMSSIYEEHTSATKWKNTTCLSSSKSLKSFSTSSSQTNLQPAKFVSMAEAIYHLQRDTPERFHSYSKKQELHAAKFTSNRKDLQRKMPCIPHSPALLSKNRTRNIKILSQKEKEDLEVEELKRIHIKANPISKFVLQGYCNFPPVQRRPTTQPEPFNLTQIKKKPPPQEKKIVFTARPIPKHILEKPTELPKKVIPVTVPRTPKFMARSRSLENMQCAQPEITPILATKKIKCPLQIVDKIDGMPPETQVGHSGVPLAQKLILHPCKPKPFSFEQRDKERLNKKMEKIQQFYQEEKKMREFHANPLPSVLKKKGFSPKPRLYEKKPDSKKENKENESDEQRAFKARPPLVLFKEPFIPAKKERPVLEPCQKQLTTEIRARERDAFNQKVKEKEEQIEMLKKLAEEEKLKKEEEEKAALRVHLVHKAAPIKHYAPVIIHPSHTPLTRPESPKFLHK